METQDAMLEKTTLIAVRTRSGDLQLGLGARLEERKDAVTRSFYIDRCWLLVRSIGRGLAVVVNAAVSGQEIISSHDGAILQICSLKRAVFGADIGGFGLVSLPGGFALVFFYGGQKISLCSAVAATPWQPTFRSEARMGRFHARAH
jgi:hypothetical protein